MYQLNGGNEALSRKCKCCYLLYTRRIFKMIQLRLILHLTVAFCFTVYIV